MTDQVTQVRTRINGEAVTLTVPNRLTLAEVLRDECGLTGTKVSCDMQVCGACTVLVDGEPVSSCTYLGPAIDGRDVTTIEGLSNGSQLHPIQQAFLDKFALQCGYCTPGFVLMAKALLDDDPAPSREAVADYLDGNICRCTGYQPIIDAVLDASARIRPADDG